VIPADNKHVMQAFCAAILVDAIGSLNLEWPTVSDSERVADEKARQELQAEIDVDTVPAARTPSEV
jgi:hypothetical protein